MTWFTKAHPAYRHNCVSLARIHFSVLLLWQKRTKISFFDQKLQQGKYCTLRASQLIYSTTSSNFRT